MPKKKQRLELLLAKAKRGDVEACCDVGVRYYQLGQYKTSVKWIRKAAELGYAHGQFNLAALYERGLGVAQNQVKAAEWYRKSAEQGDAVGQYEIARLYDKGLGVKQSAAEAFKWYLKSATQGFVWSQICLAEFYERGRSVRRNDVESYFWFSLAAFKHPAYAELKNSVEERLTPEERAAVKRRVKGWKAGSRNSGTHA